MWRGLPGGQATASLPDPSPGAERDAAPRSLQRVQTVREAPGSSCTWHPFPPLKDKCRVSLQ